MLGHAELADKVGCTAAKAHRVDRLLRIAEHFLFIHGSEFGSGLPAHENIFRHRHMWNQHQLLVDDSNPELLRVFNLADDDRLSINENLSAVDGINAAQHVDKR